MIEAVTLDTAFSKIVNEHHRQPLVEYYQNLANQRGRERDALRHKLQLIDVAMLKEKRVMRILECVIAPLQILAIVLMITDVLSFRVCCLITYGLLLPLVFHAGRWLRAYLTRKEVMKH